MKNLLLLVCLIACTFNPCLGQSNKLDKSLDKANDLINQGKVDDADTYLQKILDKNPDFGKGWDLLAQVRYQEYQNSKSLDGMNLFGGKITVEDKDKGTKDTARDDSIARQLTSLLNKMKPSKVAFNKFLYTLREATLMSSDAYISSFYLRHFYVDIEIDTNVNEKALKYFNDAESAFSNKNYDKAAQLYKRALDEQPNFYKASMYLGDAYYFLGYYAEAQTAFQNCVNKFPFLLEPRKYLIDTYSKEGLNDKAYTTSVDAMTIYPDFSLVQKLDDAAYLTGKKVSITRTLRPVFPNKIITDTNLDLNAYKPDKELVAKGPWKYYKASFDKIKGYCDNKGIIVKPNSLTKSQYMEVYGWEEMLKNSNDPILDEARIMQKAGFLDCYVLVSCFHQDFYEQYKDFVTKNKAKVIEYFNKFTN